MDRSELLEKVHELNWMHEIDLGDGITTPGKWPRNPNIVKAFDQLDFKDKKVLDIGTCNGLWSFEAEKRGASSVDSVDYLKYVDYWCSPAYRLAHDALKSKAKYNPDMSVYDIESLGSDNFDIIIFCGVYYHLKNPLLALAKLRKTLKAGGTIIIEGPAILDENNAYATFLYKAHAGEDKSNWWIPTIRCLREWIECSYFKIEREYSDRSSDTQRELTFQLKQVVKQMLGRSTNYTSRFVITAESIVHKDPNYAAPDDDLVAFHK